MPANTPRPKPVDDDLSSYTNSLREYDESHEVSQSIGGDSRAASKVKTPSGTERSPGKLGEIL